MTFRFEIWRGACDLLVTAELVYVNADPRSMAAAPLPEEVRQRVRAFEKMAPAQ